MLARIVGAFVLLVTVAPAGAQVVITGTVRTDGGPRLEGARIQVVGTGAGAVSGRTGGYRIILPKRMRGRTVALRVEGAGVGTIERRVALATDSLSVDFVLPHYAGTGGRAELADRLEARVADVATTPGRASMEARGYVKSGATGGRSVRVGGPSSRRGGALTDTAPAAELAAAGVLTAAVWDDLAHPKEFQRYLTRAGQAGENEWSLDPSRATKPAPMARGSSRSALDLGFLVDATGSMGDEMQFLQTELRDIVTRVRAAEPELDIRIAIVFYRDRGDEFVTKALPFTRNVDSAVTFLGATSAGGGGDFPEDMNAGFLTMMQQDWSADVAPRMLFVIGDAPPQKYQDERYTYREAIGDASRNRVAIYPVAASGIDKPTEYLFRSMAAMTGGKYIFLTDDSGVGESHEKPEISGYEVEKLNELMVREIRKYVRGYLAPTAVAER